ncbi:glycosyltransferase family 2 protein [Mucilaginibacter rubeus]|uniref:Glycosyltransferase family 2 protein n=1 Tax=Mucilaginibacter rubeus TaxID=2027860 RepID=A0A5C1I0H6_9SPHI|nr:glycosyltransferase family 2 protein [Mucilaginibacter rubeus]QEM11413.1 glycosyltransferase family 2 protein [Mucilaginibacter rubeus]
MNDQLVSVIMPAYNAEKYIAASIESVIQQTYTNWELLIVDDGSTDQTAAIIKRYISADKRVKYFFQENGRQGKAKNLAIANSSGVFLAFLDADDLWLKEKLEVSIHEINTRDYSLVFTDCYIFEGELPEDFSTLKTMGVQSAVYEGRPALLTFLNYNQIPNLTVLAKKELFLNTGGFIDKVVAEDYEMWLRLLKNGAVFKALPLQLSLYRVHSESITARDRHATLELIEIIKTFGKENPDYWQDVQTIIREKLKHWLYYGHQRTAKNFRALIKGVFNLPLTFLFYTLSRLMPVDQLRKIVIRSY